MYNCFIKRLAILFWWKESSEDSLFPHKGHIRQTSLKPTLIPRHLFNWRAHAYKVDCIEHSRSICKNVLDQLTAVRSSRWLSAGILTCEGECVCNPQVWFILSILTPPQGLSRQPGSRWLVAWGSVPRERLPSETTINFRQWEKGILHLPSTYTLSSQGFILARQQERQTHHSRSVGLQHPVQAILSAQHISQVTATD